MVGKSGYDNAPFATGVTKTVDSLIDLWNQQFNNWFDSMKNQLDSDAAGHLQNEIESIKTGYVSKTATAEQSVVSNMNFQNGIDVAGIMTLDSSSYGATLPTDNLIEGRIFFKEADS